MQPWPETGTGNDDFCRKLIAELTVSEANRWLRYLTQLGIKRFWYIELPGPRDEIANA